MFRLVYALAAPRLYPLGGANDVTIRGHQQEVSQSLRRMAGPRALLLSPSMILSVPMGTVAIDYPNAQAASSTTKGFLTSRRLEHV